MYKMKKAARKATGIISAIAVLLSAQSMIFPRLNSILAAESVQSYTDEFDSLDSAWTFGKGITTKSIENGALKIAGAQGGDFNNQNAIVYSKPAQGKDVALSVEFQRADDNARAWGTGLIARSTVSYATALETGGSAYVANVCVSNGSETDGTGWMQIGKVVNGEYTTLGSQGIGWLEGKAKYRLELTAKSINSTETQLTLVLNVLFTGQTNWGELGRVTITDKTEALQAAGYQGISYRNALGTQPVNVYNFSFETLESPPEPADPIETYTDEFDSLDSAWTFGKGITTKSIENGALKIAGAQGGDFNNQNAIVYSKPAQGKDVALSVEFQRADDNARAWGTGLIARSTVSYATALETSGSAYVANVCVSNGNEDGNGWIQIGKVVNGEYTTLGSQGIGWLEGKAKYRLELTAKSINSTETQLTLVLNVLFTGQTNWGEQGRVTITDKTEALQAAGYQGISYRNASGTQPVNVYNFSFETLESPPEPADPIETYTDEFDSLDSAWTFGKGITTKSIENGSLKIAGAQGEDFNKKNALIYSKPARDKDVALSVEFRRADENMSAWGIGLIARSTVSYAKALETDGSAYVVNLCVANGAPYQGNSAWLGIGKVENGTHTWIGGNGADVIGSSNWDMAWLEPSSKLRLEFKVRSTSKTETQLTAILYVYNDTLSNWTKAAELTQKDTTAALQTEGGYQGISYRNNSGTHPINVFNFGFTNPIAPKITNEGDTLPTAVQGEHYDTKITASQLYDTNFKYTAKNLPECFTLDELTGELLWNQSVQVTEIKTYKIDFTVEDDLGKTAEKTMSVEVMPSYLFMLTKVKEFLLTENESHKNSFKDINNSGNIDICDLVFLGELTGANNKELFADKFNNTYYKLKTEKKLNIAYFGGSITVGAGTDNKSKSWASRTTDWFKGKFPDAQITANNAGIGGTGTVFGAYRAVEELKLQSPDEKPDLVFIEFAINDVYDGTTPNEAKNYLENIIRKIYQYVPNADIMVLFTTDMGKADSNYEIRQAHKLVADAYKLPSLAVGEALVKEVIAEGGTGGITQTVWDKYFSDVVHPSNDGHGKYASYVTKYFDLAFYAKDSVPTGLTESYQPDKPLYGAVLENSHTANLKGQTAPAGFTIDKEGAIISANGSDKSFTVTFTGTSLRLWFDGVENGGILETEVDGKAADEVSLVTYPNQRLKSVVEGLEDKEHTVKFTLKDSGKGSYMKILRFCITGSDLNSEVKIG